VGEHIEASAFVADGDRRCFAGDDFDGEVVLGRGAAERDEMGDVLAALESGLEVVEGEEL
jgi:hypothetical protein